MSELISLIVLYLAIGLIMGAISEYSRRLEAIVVLIATTILIISYLIIPGGNIVAEPWWYYFVAMPGAIIGTLAGKQMIKELKQ